MEYLLRRQRQVVPREEIRQALWPDDRDDTDLVDICIHYLRRKVDHDSRRWMIRSVRGVGYTLKA